MVLRGLVSLCQSGTNLLFHTQPPKTNYFLLPNRVWHAFLNSSGLDCSEDVRKEAAKTEARFARLAEKIDALDQELQTLGHLLKEKTLLASHPAYDYLARRYDWQLISFDLDPETPLTQEQTKSLAAAIESNHPTAILWESEPNAEISAQVLATWGLPSVVWDPCESPPEGESAGFIERQRANAARLTSLLR